MTWLLWTLCALFCRVAGSITGGPTWWLIHMFDCEERAAAHGIDWLSLVALLFMAILAAANLHALRLELEQCR